ncbi:tRNA uridine-5-carboxymethylaminomethyl(34) synthesis enzyme MnmG [Corallococcus praedator]|uniref:tRNA uridine 5-carboxymethylaminomethyl modification enzyme MnmG n=1 Tax=Corallococcus praedator TaxID=2316724 RepID=A0ABX9QGC6_9BACT|nr:MULTISPECIES: tRNA uridine-5-carboxymethylaminomethyl(34) synthesis enzyme MnmG [Corallococcus]RKH31759.1 tRNA uridine-5-carboxymethylaminomethyl(34) synthesis enzyme MnmG [Corallococcus sp. CA031C]RKI06501.1 tRNA uridine-5-carboxymethylaminomethyl(34) synthesis enzyme MnmG [Corallococcus praedator]
MQLRYDIVVVGLGHAGCEAALACARLGLSTLGVTLKRDRAAVMSCNPAVGGTAKGHLVREMDALGGQMGRVADLAGTHFKTLNPSKGPAVQATRVLCDRDAYAAGMQAVLFSEPNLTVLEGEVASVVAEAGQVRGVVLGDGTQVLARAVLLTTGTFLRALMHVGEQKEVGGRLGDDAARGLSESLHALGFTLGRFKTGTPARLSRDSIDWDAVTPQPGDTDVRPFSWRTQVELTRGQPFPRQPAVMCGLTATTQATHQLLRDNLHRSPLFQGDIVGRGPRYCPSLEDKVVRFAARERHQVFLEPEGPTSPLVYPAGLSTSMPADVQLAFLRTIPGLSHVEVIRYGYAVEYDFAPPTQLHSTLETKAVQGLYFAGQLNGTSGYEEAAFQGLWAGLQAALKVKGEPALIIGREEAHGAVLVDDLVTKGVDEPFRMFTSRSEHRLKLREGNADLRLAKHGHRVGLLPKEALERAEARAHAVTQEVARIKRVGLGLRLKRPEVSYAQLAEGREDFPVLGPDVTEEVEVEVKYEGYIAQAERAAAREAEASDRWRIPEAFRFADVRGLGSEAVEKLSAHRPGTVGQARRIPGLTPAAVSLLLVALKRGNGARRDQEQGCG